MKLQNLESLPEAQTQISTAEGYRAMIAMIEYFSNMDADLDEMLTMLDECPPKWDGVPLMGWRTTRSSILVDLDGSSKREKPV